MNFNFVFFSRFTCDVGGYPFLYADIFMDRKEFEKMFDLLAYEKVRGKYHANGAFPHLYDKVRVSVYLQILNEMKYIFTF